MDESCEPVELCFLTAVRTRPVIVLYIQSTVTHCTRRSNHHTPTAHLRGEVRGRERERQQSEPNPTPRRPWSP